MDESNCKFDELDKLKEEFDELDKLNCKFEELDKLKDEFDECDKLNCKFDELDKLKDDLLYMYVLLYVCSLLFMIWHICTLFVDLVKLSSISCKLS